MGAARITINASFPRAYIPDPATEGDVRELAALLQGDSVVDWTRLHFRSIPAVDRFLAVCGYDVENPTDLARLQYIHREAVRYVRSTLEIEVASVLTLPLRIQNVFMYASSRNRHRSQACMVLKAMHVIHHLEARELLFHLPCSEQLLFHRVDEAVSETVNSLIEAGLGVYQFHPSRKTKESLITKLLSKRKTTAAQVFDRIRFRIITHKPSDIMPVLLFMKRHLVPFAFVVPGEATNTLSPLRELFSEGLGVEGFDCPTQSQRPAFNRFSHEEFRVVSFVVDLPVKVTDLVKGAPSPILSRFGDVVLIPTEFQVFDRSTFEANEGGPASHLLYKERQITEVVRRLYSGRPTEEL